VRDFGAMQHEQCAASVRLLAKLHRDNRRLHLYACLGDAVPSGRLSNPAQKFLMHDCLFDRVS
jgi:hypothetical protein